MKPFATTFVGMGGNIGDPVASFHEALNRLDQIENVSVQTVSSLYRTRPVGYENQATFINAVAKVLTRVEPLEFLDRLLQIETQLGRTRGTERFGPRLIDLDLLLYDEQQIQLPRLTLPHPRMHERRFALEPLAEIAPQTMVPGHGSVTVILSQLEQDGVELLRRDWFRATSEASASAVTGAMEVGCDARVPAED